MHHKFAIADRQVMSGSFNWSRNAMLGNDENVMFIDKAQIADKYIDVFETLWSKYNPGKADSS